MTSEGEQKGGVSLRTIHACLVVGAVVISGMMLFSTYHLFTSFSHLTQASEEQIELNEAARELMDASDYLTEMVQRYSINGDLKYLDGYFQEAFDNHRREEAVERMAEGDDATKALENLQAAMDASIKLMDREYYAMRLVLEAKGSSGMPDVLKDVQLTDEDQALSPEEKMARAAQMVHDDDYYEQKDNIRAHMRASLDELERMAYEKDEAALASFRSEMTIIRVVIIIQVVGIIFMVWLTSRLGIHPILNAVERIKEDSPIPEVGANEFRYLARTYNRIYEVYKRSLEHLNYTASHDKLTGAYNRSGYDLLLSSVDLSSTYVLLFDVDNFKAVNDTYGHEVGDMALVKLAQTLRSSFRSDDYVCRIGGDEFVVFMVHAAETHRDLVVAKVESINESISQADGEVPALSVSVGIIHGSQAPDAKSLFEKVDAAMYTSKKQGKHTYTFYIT